MKRIAMVTLLVAVGALPALAADLNGRWSGSFVVTAPNGETKNDTAVIDLVQKGDEITGQAGSDADHQWPIQNGKVDGDHLTFELDADGTRIRVVLTLADGHLKGEASGGDSTDAPHATLDLTRQSQ